MHKESLCGICAFLPSSAVFIPQTSQYLCVEGSTHCGINLVGAAGLIPPGSVILLLSHREQSVCVSCCHCFFPVQHDDREGEGAEKWVNRGRGRGAFPRGRGRFMFRKSSTSPKWAHDKFSGEEGEIEDDESGTENREEKDNLQSTTE